MAKEFTYRPPWRKVESHPRSDPQYSRSRARTVCHHIGPATTNVIRWMFAEGRSVDEIAERLRCLRTAVVEVLELDVDAGMPVRRRIPLDLPRYEVRQSTVFPPGLVVPAEMPSETARAIVKMDAEHKNDMDIAAELGVSTDDVIAVTQLAQATEDELRYPDCNQAERNRQMRTLYQNGYSIQQLVEHFGLGIAYVRAVVGRPWTDLHPHCDTELDVDAGMPVPIPLRRGVDDPVAQQIEQWAAKKKPGERAAGFTVRTIIVDALGVDTITHGYKTKVGLALRRLRWTRHDGKPPKWFPPADAVGRPWTDLTEVPDPL